MLTFNEFLDTDVEDFKIIFNFYLNFLGELSGKNFPFDEQIKLRGAGDKFLNTIKRISYIDSNQMEEYLKLVDIFYTELNYYRGIEARSVLLKFLFGNRSKRILLSVQDAFQKLYSQTVQLINKATISASYLEELKINDFFKPENTDRQKLKDLINEAINLIKGDENISEKTKKALYKYLEKVLNELENKTVNWTRFLGRIKQTIIVLGALGSLIGGANTLYNAQAKLEQTTEVIQKTSVNINHKVINETFNIQNIGSLNLLLELPEKTDTENQN